MYRVSEIEETTVSGEPTQEVCNPSDSKDTSESATANAGASLVSSLTLLDCKGVALGCFVLARCLQLGQAVARNEKKAHEYYNKAIRFDKKVVAELHDKLTHGQL